MERVGLRVEGGVLRVTEPREGGRREKKRRREGGDRAVRERDLDLREGETEKEERRRRDRVGTRGATRVAKSR